MNNDAKWNANSLRMSENSYFSAFFVFCGETHDPQQGRWVLSQGVTIWAAVRMAWNIMMKFNIQTFLILFPENKLQVSIYDQLSLDYLSATFFGGKKKSILTFSYRSVHHYKCDINKILWLENCWNLVFYHCWSNKDVLLKHFPSFSQSSFAVAGSRILYYLQQMANAEKGIS